MVAIPGFEPSPRSLGVALLAGTGAGLWLLARARRSFWLCALLALPGTLCHEFSHWLVGHLLNGRPVRFTVVPRREGRGFTLGAVAFANLRWYNAFFIGLAPLLLAPAAWGLFRWRLAGSPGLGWPEAGLGFLLANLLFAAVPSGQDLRIAARSPLGWLLLAGALGWGGWRLSRGAQRSAGISRTSTYHGDRTRGFPCA